MTYNIWRLSDGKPGHESQSIGLCNALQKIQTCRRFDIPVQNKKNYLRNLFFKTFPQGKHLPDPTLIIGAGHGTHLPMLAAQRARKGHTIVLMKPSLPISFFDFCLIAKHDHISDKNNIIVTKGALNPIQFNRNKVPGYGLFMIGGLSKHYHWNNASIIDQIIAIIGSNPDINWTIADSQRTPQSFLNEVDRQSDGNIKILRCSETNSTEIHKLIYNTRNVWVTRDSISMIYESLSSGAAVGLIDLPQNKNGRTHKSVNTLISEGYLTLPSKENTTLELKSTLPVFNEAHRCAELLLSRGVLK